MEVGVNARTLFAAMFKGSKFFKEVAKMSNPSVTKFLATHWKAANEGMTRNIKYEFTKTVALRCYRISVREVMELSASFIVQVFIR